VRFQATGAAVNGAPFIFLTVDGVLYYVYALDIDEQGLVRDVFAVANPEKLAAVRGLAG
jgi:RNA polymerase sigma-70 factor, ECF subfamily